MTRYRPFRNSDPPKLLEIWRSQAPSRGLAQGLSLDAFEQLVLSKTYFDRLGLLVAEEAGQLVGFAHAGFGPSADRSTMSHVNGVTCLVMVVPHSQRDRIAAELIERCERYLRERGAETLWGGSCGEICPFYLGLYGGGSAPGLLDSDPHLVQWFAANGYELAERVSVVQRQLADFRPAVNREQMQIRRRFTLETQLDPVPIDWWEASTRAVLDRTQFSLQGRSGGKSRGSAVFSELEWFSRSLGARVCSLDQFDGDGLGDEQEALFLLNEALRQLQSQGVQIIEAHRCPQRAEPSLLETLGFEQIDTGGYYRKAANL